MTTEAELLGVPHREVEPVNAGDIAYELRLSRAEVGAMRREVEAIARELVTVRELVELLVAVADVEPVR